MARAYPAMTTPQVSVTYYLEKTLGNKSDAVMRTHYTQTLKQADRGGVIRLNAEGKITEILNDKIIINIPAGLYPEDVYSLNMLDDINFDTEPTEKKG